MVHGKEGIVLAIFKTNLEAQILLTADVKLPHGPFPPKYLSHSYHMHPSTGHYAHMH